ncbi:Proteasome maturation factor Ump1 [Abortiporus biennis]
MEPSLRIVPSSTPKAASVQDTSNSLGLHDTLRYGPRSLATEAQSSCTIKDRLENWEITQDNLKLTQLRNVYGLAAPVRLLMERKMVGYNPHMPALKTSNVHLDVLMGRDETIECADFMMPANELQQPLDIHQEMEKKLHM